MNQPPGSIRDRGKLPQRLHQARVREPLIFLAFLALTAMMTWPWVLHLRDGVPDSGDTYSIAYYLWWDFHQTFRDPFNLFHATVFYPYKYTLAFGENDYGISLLFFWLFALGARPLTVYSVAALTSFAFSGYGMFRLARTLSASNIVAWTAGVVFAFLPFRFQHLNHLHLLFAGWIPLTLEALVLFARERTWKRAVWLALAFVMNALTCLTWFVLILIPLSLSGIMLLTSNRSWRRPDLWLRLSAAGLLASLLLLPFLLPYVHVARAFGFVRDAAEVQTYSALPINWLATVNNKLWQGLGAAGARPEMSLFPGLFPLLLALAALLLVDQKAQNDGPPRIRPSWRKIAVLILDCTAIVSGIVALLAAGYEHFSFGLFGRTLLSARTPARPLVVLAVALTVRCLLSTPRALRAFVNKLNEFFSAKKRRAASSRPSRNSELMIHGVLWCAIGFAGSFGLNFFFYRVLYPYIPLFRSMRVAARWSMICYLGLALLAGLGAKRLVELLRRHWPQPQVWLACLVLIGAILFEQRAAPLSLIKGESGPDELTLYLKHKPMSGGIVELPAGYASKRYMLRAADHGRPLVTARESFMPPIASEIERLTSAQPIPDRFLDLLEQIPASYLTIHNGLATPEKRVEFEKFLDQALTSGRLRFIRSFAGAIRNGVRERNDLYAVVRTEPGAQSEAPRPPPFSNETKQPSPIGNFEQKSFFTYRLYRASYGRAPLFVEFMPDAQFLDRNPNDPAAGLEQNKNLFVESWINRPEFRLKFDGVRDEQFVDTMLAQTGLAKNDALKQELLKGLGNRNMTRAAALRKVADDATFAAREFKPAFVLIHYFAYLRRDPETGGFLFWLDYLQRNPDYRNFTEVFAASTERLDQPLP